MVRCEALLEVRKLRGDGASLNLCRQSSDLYISSDIDRLNLSPGSRFALWQRLRCFHAMPSYCGTPSIRVPSYNTCNI